MFELTVSDGLTPCGECGDYIDTKTEGFIALVIPMRGDHQWRGVNTYHAKCFRERDHSVMVLVVTGVTEAGDGRRGL